MQQNIGSWLAIGVAIVVALGMVIGSSRARRGPGHARGAPEARGDTINAAATDRPADHRHHHHHDGGAFSGGHHGAHGGWSGGGFSDGGGGGHHGRTAPAGVHEVVASGASGQDDGHAR